MVVGRGGVMLLLYRVVPFASCLMFYGHHRKESDFRSNNGILLKLISMLHAIMLSVRVMSICFHKFQTFKQFQTIINSIIHRTLSETLSCAAVRAPHQTVRSPSRSRHVQCYDTPRRTSTGAHLPFPARREWCPALTHPVTGAAPPPDTYL